LYSEEMNPNSVEPHQPMSIFKIPKFDSFKTARIGYLTPGIKYEFWLEAYLTNGKLKKTNVLEVVTKDEHANHRHPPSPIVGSDDHDHSHRDHTPMGTIVASTVAALAVIGLIIVTALYLKRTTTYKAIISGGKQKAASSELPVANNDFMKRPSSKPNQAPSVPNGSGNSIEMNGINKNGQTPANGGFPSSNGNGISGNGSGRVNEGASLEDRGPPPPPVQPRPPGPPPR